MKVGRHTVWQKVVGSTPAPDRGLVVETLACGHSGKRTEEYRVWRRVEAGALRVCLVCTNTKKVIAQQQAWTAKQFVCAGKRPSLSEAAAQAEAQRWQGRMQVYACHVCQQWHLASQR